MSNLKTLFFIFLFICTTMHGSMVHESVGEQLYDAILQNKLVVVEELVDNNANLDMQILRRPPHLFKPLALAIKFQRLEIVCALLFHNEQNRANPNATHKGVSLLHLAINFAQKPESVDLMSLLLQAGAHVTTPDNITGNTAEQLIEENIDNAERDDMKEMYQNMLKHLARQPETIQEAVERVCSSILLAKKCYVDQELEF